jgi:hypothetical protein
MLMFSNDELVRRTRGLDVECWRYDKYFWRYRYIVILRLNIYAYTHTQIQTQTTSTTRRKKCHASFSIRNPHSALCGIVLSCCFSYILSSRYRSARVSSRPNTTRRMHSARLLSKPQGLVSISRNTAIRSKVARCETLQNALHSLHKLEFKYRCISEFENHGRESWLMTIKIAR